MDRLSSSNVAVHVPRRAGAFVGQPIIVLGFCGQLKTDQVSFEPLLKGVLHTKIEKIRKDKKR